MNYIKIPRLNGDKVKPWLKKKCMKQRTNAPYSLLRIVLRVYHNLSFLTHFNFFEKIKKYIFEVSCWFEANLYPREREW